MPRHTLATFGSASGCGCSRPRRGVHGMGDPAKRERRGRSSARRTQVASCQAGATGQSEAATSGRRWSKQQHGHSLFLRPCVCPTRRTIRIRASGTVHALQLYSPHGAPTQPSACKPDVASQVVPRRACCGRRQSSCRERAVSRGMMAWHGMARARGVERKKRVGGWPAGGRGGSGVGNELRLCPRSVRRPLCVWIMPDLQAGRDMGGTTAPPASSTSGPKASPCSGAPVPSAREW
jgi:hypothetical protein